ncbi:MAG: response regulator [Calditrichaceae bacterium]|nr:response regulator [Calditrichaceae bacterium]MBN2707786.1 response regulator [Calditrichaceae bacterium]RQV96288.1 MAG: response regulator [Calditrichota bacterium]
MQKILWADDEIEILQAHVLFLREKGYIVKTVTNGDDAVYEVKHNDYDMILLDEMMPGKDGLTTLNEIKDLAPQLPVIMITKSEEESLMEDAIGKRIDDYLTKPVNPSQILMACKKILNSKNIISEKRSQAYTNEIARISMSLMDMSGHEDWIDLAIKISRMDMDIDDTSDNFREILYNQRREVNVEFGKYIEKKYEVWVNNMRNKDRPLFSVDVIPNYIIPRLKSGKQVVFIVIDCLRMDQWFTLEPYFYDLFRIDKDYYFSILPTATPFSRNAIFSGLFPIEIEKQYPDLWSLNEDDESLNRYEKELLDLQLQRNGLNLHNDLKYIKIMNRDDMRNFEKNIHNYLDSQMLAIVINFVDILAHSRSDLPILKEIVPDEAAFRSLTSTWYNHSPMIGIMEKIARSKANVFITSDHGSIRGLRGSKVIGDRDTSTNLRYKYGRSLKADKKNAIFIKNPATWKLPNRGINTTYIIAKEDYYFVYPTNYSKYLNYYKDSFQHGGVSIEEMVLPIVSLENK